MKRGKPLKRRRKAVSEALTASQTHFRETVCAEPCLFSTTRPEHECDGPLDPHHVLPAQFLKGCFGRDREEKKWPLVYAPEIGVPLCRKAHDLVTVHADYVYRSELPARVIDWAQAHGLMYRLELECPSLTEDAA